MSISCVERSQGGQAVSHIVDAHYWRIIADLNRNEAKLLDRIKRLEEAGDELAKWADRNTPHTIRNDWTKAKEAKP